MSEQESDHSRRLEGGELEHDFQDMSAFQC